LRTGLSREKDFRGSKEKTAVSNLPHGYPRHTRRNGGKQRRNPEKEKDEDASARYYPTFLRATPLTISLKKKRGEGEWEREVWSTFQFVQEREKSLVLCGSGGPGPKILSREVGGGERGRLMGGIGIAIRRDNHAQGQGRDRLKTPAYFETVVQFT